MKIIILSLSLLLILTQNNAAANEVTSSILAKGIMSWDKGLLEYGKGKPEMTIQKINIAANDQEVSLAMHCHNMPLAAFVLKGSVKVIKPNGDSQFFKQGSAFIEVMNQWHKGVFVENTELIVFYAGIKGTALSVKKGGDTKLSKLCQ